MCHGMNQLYDSFINFANRNGDTKKIDQPKFEMSILVASISSAIVAYRTERFLTSKICRPLLYVYRT